MDKRTLTALKASIKHWEENVAAETPKDASTDSGHCALCEEFPGDDCEGCPVRERTGKRECKDTPYYKARSALYGWTFGKGDRERWQAAAQAELDFLKSLLPALTQQTQPTKENEG